MKPVSLIVLTIIFFSCKTDIEKKVGHDSIPPKIDTTKLTGDTFEVYTPEPGDCLYGVFKGTKKYAFGNEILIVDDKETTTKELLEAEPYVGNAIASKNNLDIDNDGQQELWLRGHTGGAHCCDEWMVFLKQPDGKFKISDSVIAGHLCFDGKLFTYELTESLGYFQSCYGCGYDDSANGFVQMREIKLQFDKGKFPILPLSEKESQQLFKNLFILQQKIKHAGKDERKGDYKKEFAMNIGVFYFSNNKNWNTTHELFKKYYTMKDAGAIAKELKAALDYIDARNGF